MLKNMKQTLMSLLKEKKVCCSNSDHCSEFSFLESKNQVMKPVTHCSIKLRGKKCIPLYMHAFLDTLLLKKHILCLCNHQNPCRSCRSIAFHIEALSSQQKSLLIIGFKDWFIYL